MLKKGYSTKEIAFLISSYSKNDIEALRRKLQEEKDSPAQ